MLLAVALVTSAHTAAMPFLPEFAARSAPGAGTAGHVDHVAGLTAAFPAAALLTAPLWGWLSDKAGERRLLMTSVGAFGLTALLFGNGGLSGLYFVRFALGIFFAGVTTIAFAVTARAARDCVERARRFAWLTASMFAGDLAGPVLGESSRLLGASSPLAIAAILTVPILIGIGKVAFPIAFRLQPQAVEGPMSARTGSLILLFAVALVGGAGLATLHVLLLLSEQPGGLTRQIVSWTLSACGAGMLAAQLAYSRGKRLSRNAHSLILPTLMVFLSSLAAAAYVRTTLPLSLSVFAAGATAAALRLVTSYLASRIDRRRIGFWLGVNQSATSLGQTIAPLAIAGLGVSGKGVMLLLLAAVSLPLTLMSTAESRAQAQS
ncbi:MFS transporter [Sphingomonas sp. ID1715]|uniref:MFS transporter n=1 Tax=Sphingomonas sp. ID1715 TaxID=1656898 RepID=UPI001C2CAAA8|nr:MFS transporter [Sphingomonas sp. ID1715]